MVAIALALQAGEARQGMVGWQGKAEGPSLLEAIIVLFGLLCFHRNGTTPIEQTCVGALLTF